jgi:hypothetical protein
MIVSSEEMIERDDEPQPSTSGAVSISDPDFVLPDPKAKMKTRLPLKVEQDGDAH